MTQRSARNTRETHAQSARKPQAIRPRARARACSTSPCEQGHPNASRRTCVHARGYEESLVLGGGANFSDQAFVLPCQRFGSQLHVRGEFLRSGVCTAGCPKERDICRDCAELQNNKNLLGGARCLSTGTNSHRNAAICPFDCPKALESVLTSQPNKLLLLCNHMSEAIFRLAEAVGPACLLFHVRLLLCICDKAT